MTRFVASGLIVATTAAGLFTAAPAAADCTSSGGVTICAQGSVEGPAGQPAPSAGPYYPYPCEADWLCDDGGVSIVIDPGPPGPPHPPRPPRPRPNG